MIVFITSAGPDQSVADDGSCRRTSQAFCRPTSAVDFAVGPFRGDGAARVREADSVDAIQKQYRRRRAACDGGAVAWRRRLLPWCMVPAAHWSSLSAGQRSARAHPSPSPVRPGHVPRSNCLRLFGACQSTVLTRRVGGDRSQIVSYNFHVSSRVSRRPCRCLSFTQDCIAFNCV